MATSEIEKLERRYAENPQGLTFAPLAEVHRKNGDLGRALELLRAGLELHPNYIPASIVLGRCHWDQGDLPAAESAFAHVLRLDDENVIALKSLADINERLERFSDAQRWLQRLVAIDRSNEEARQQLNRLETAKAHGHPKGTDAPEPGAAADLPHEIAAVEPEPSASRVPPISVLPPEPAPVQKPAPLSEPAPVESPLDLTAAIAEPAAPAKVNEPISEKTEPQSPALEFLDTSEPTQKPAEGITPAGPAPVAGLISQEFVAPKESTYPVHPELTQELMSPKYSPDQLDVETMEEVELQSSGAAEFRVPNAAEDFMDLQQVAPARPAEVATPGGLEPAVSGPTAEMRRPSYSAHDTNGQSVASFFQALLAARPPGNSGPPTSPSSPVSEGGAPTRPAQDALSLSSVFGEESLPMPPAVPASGPAKDAVVSFDDFFSSPAGGSSPLPKGGPDPRRDDLDQFQSWLQNLKR